MCFLSLYRLLAMVINGMHGKGRVLWPSAPRMVSSCRMHVFSPFGLRTGTGPAPARRLLWSVAYFTTFTAFPPFFTITTWPGLASLMRWP